MISGSNSLRVPGRDPGTAERERNLTGNHINKDTWSLTSQLENTAVVLKMKNFWVDEVDV